LRVPVAAFSTETVSAGGYSRISEFAVRYQVQFEVTDAAGQVLVPSQRIDMSREYSYDATNTVGNASQVQEIQRSLNDDMVQAILFRLQAASTHPAAAAAQP
jgi:LPS-assembly lipoprotein